MSNWDILVKVCDRLADKESKGDEREEYMYRFKNCTIIHTTYLSPIQKYNSNTYRSGSKIVYWIK